MLSGYLRGKDTPCSVYPDDEVSKAKLRFRCFAKKKTILNVRLFDKLSATTPNEIFPYSFELRGLCAAGKLKDGSACESKGSAIGHHKNI